MPKVLAGYFIWLTM